MSRSQVVFQAVEAQYQASTTAMGLWMWHNHTQWVADTSRALAEKYGANAEVAYCAALLHDLGDAKYERGHADFDTWSWNEAKAILKAAGFRHAEREEILEAVRTHSCHPGHLPTTIEGKVLATADGMWHLQTSFFPAICFMRRPDEFKTYTEWQVWFRQKIDRDFNVKLFFDDERAEVRADYEALINVFSKAPLVDSSQGTINF